MQIAITVEVEEGFDVAEYADLEGIFHNVGGEGFCIYWEGDLGKKLKVVDVRGEVG